MSHLRRRAQQECEAPKKKVNWNRPLSQLTKVEKENPTFPKRLQAHSRFVEMDKEVSQLKQIVLQDKLISQLTRANHRICTDQVRNIREAIYDKPHYMR